MTTCFGRAWPSSRQYSIYN